MPKLKNVSPFFHIDRQEKMIELNQKRLIPEKQIANWLNNIKNTKKHIYEDSIATYIEEANQVGKKLKKKP
jgi:hypothetical protein